MELSILHFRQILGATAYDFRQKVMQAIELDRLKKSEDKTQAEMAQLWERDISERTISRALQQIGFTCKKNLWVLPT